MRPFCSATTEVARFWGIFLRCPVDPSRADSPQGNHDEQDTNHRDSAAVIYPPYIADHETIGGPIYISHTLSGEENSAQTSMPKSNSSVFISFLFDR
jgi:hypothetical protein